MPNVPPTSMTTDSPNSSELNLNDGFAIFPAIGVAKLGTQLGKGTGTFFQDTLNFEVFKIDIGAFHSTFIGICGPSYATDLDVVAGTSYEVPAPGEPAKGTLVIGDNDLRGGFQYGIDFEVDFDIEVDLNLVFVKRKLLDFTISVDIDVIELIKDLVLSILQSGGGGGKPEEYELSTFSADNSASVEQMGIEEGTGGTGGPKGGPKKGSVAREFSGAGMVDYIAKPWTQPPGETRNSPPSGRLDPSFAFGFSVVPLFAGIPFLDALAALDEALHAIGGGFSLGPGLAVGLPTTVSVKGATIDNHPFDVTSAGGSQSGSDPTVTMPLVERTPIDERLRPLGDTPDEIGVLLEHKVGFNLGLYFFTDLCFFKVINIGAQTGQIPLSPTVPLGGPYENHLSYVPGGGPVPFDAPPDAPTVGPYTANQPQGAWKNGVLARYAITFYDATYETSLSPISAFDPQQRFFAKPQLSNLSTNVVFADTPPIGRRVYRQFNDGSDFVQVGEIPDLTTNTFTDTSQ